MSKAEQIRIITAIICGPNILNKADKDATIKVSKQIAEKIYNSVELNRQDFAKELSRY